MPEDRCAAFDGAEVVNALLRGGTDVSVTNGPKVKAAIVSMGYRAWIPTKYTDARCSVALRDAYCGPAPSGGSASP